MTADTDKRHHEKRKEMGHVRVTVWVHTDDREKIVNLAIALREARAADDNQGKLPL